MSQNAKNILEWFYKNHSSLVKEMMNCQHSEDLTNPNPFHMEGSVWTHTMMVYSEMAKVTDNSILLLSALLHDIGKPATRTVKGKFVSFPSHEKNGADVVKKISFDSYSTNAINEFVVELVANHGDLYKLSEEELVKKYQNDSNTFDEVCILVRADLAGSIATKGGVDWGMVERIRKAI